MFGTALSANEERKPIAEKKEEKDLDVDIPKLSEAFGHLIGKNLEAFGLHFDMGKVIKGLEDSIAGKQSPMDDTACMQAISIVQEKAFQTLAKKNLTSAEQFLSENKKTEGVVLLENDKLQYKIEKEGTGQIVKNGFTPLIRYTGKFINGDIFGSSKEDEPLCLEETIKGFSKGIVGMKEGEKRILFIHPDLGYGEAGYLPPNSLLIFDIEVVKANTIPKQEDSLTSTHSSNAKKKEIADINVQEEEKALR